MQQDKVNTEASAVNQEQLQLAQQAANGDKDARAVINQLIHHIISFQTSRFCKRFCRDNKYQYRCTLPGGWGTPPRDAVFCEWGNASYGWMLDDLTNRNRLLQYSGKHGARVNDYIYYIANSLPFYERWKDWRFGRKVHVPTYIQELCPAASKVFYGLRAGEEIPAIAQKLGMSEHDAEQLCQRIIIILTQRNRLHLLDPPGAVSLTESANNGKDDHDPESGQVDIPSFDEAPELQESKRKLAQAWDKLSPVEQYVIEAMQIDEQDASDVLHALQKMAISIKPGVAANDTSRQQLYYFRRKTLAKLAELMV